MVKRVFLATLVAMMFAGVALAGVAPGVSIDGGLDGLKAARTVADGPHPRVFIYANDIVFGSAAGLSTSVELRAIVDPNGNSAARVFFLYLRNQVTGEVRYIDNTGLLEAGVVRAIDGSGPDNFTSIAVTSLQDAVLLGPGGLVSGAIPVGGLATGNYQLVLDLREGSGQRTVVSGEFGFAVVDDVVEVSGDVTADTTWSSDTVHFINNRAVFVREGATLTIEPGTYVVGTGQNSVLVVERGAKIMADGTRARPIVMTSASLVGERERAQWGGLVLNGRAPINTGEQEGEGGTGRFGGDQPNDSSGVLRYVRVEFAGIEFSPDNELNGIAFQGVGRGTVVEHIQVHYNKDDGVEFFGGTTDAKYVLITAAADDSVDWVLGWTGRLQFVVAQQQGDDADNGVEADNLSDNNDLEPISNPTIYNATLIGDPSEDPDRSESDLGLLLREGTAGTLKNFIVTGFKEWAVDVDKAATVDRIESGLLTFTNSMFWNNAGSNGPEQFSDETDDNGELLPFTTREWMTSEESNRLMNPRLRDGFYFWAPDFRPELNSPALNKNFVAIPPDDGFFDTGVTFIGGVDPLDDWTDGWTYFGPY